MGAIDMKDFCTTLMLRRAAGIFPVRANCEDQVSGIQLCQFKDTVPETACVPNPTLVAAGIAAGSPDDGFGVPNHTSDAICTALNQKVKDDPANSSMTNANLRSACKAIKSARSDKLTQVSLCNSGKARGRATDCKARHGSGRLKNKSGVDIAIDYCNSLLALGNCEGYSTVFTINRHNASITRETICKHMAARPLATCEPLGLDALTQNVCAGVDQAWCGAEGDDTEGLCEWVNVRGACLRN